MLAKGSGDPAVAEATDLLARVVEQDIEPAPEQEGVQIRQGVTEDRVVSVTDPEMRHGRKTSSGRCDDHKAHVGMDAESELITDVEAIPGNVPDRSAVPGVLERGKRLDIPQDEITADHAYGDMGTRSLCSAHGVDLVAPQQRPSPVGGRFTKMEFHIDLEAKTCICPVGAVGQPRYRRDGQLYAFQFSRASCGNCPLRERCTTAAACAGDVNPDEVERQRLYREHTSPMTTAAAADGTPSCPCRALSPYSACRHHARRRMASRPPPPGGGPSPEHLEVFPGGFSLRCKLGNFTPMLTRADDCCTATL